MKILVTGTAGQLAQSLLAAGLAAGVDVVAMRRPQLDLTIPGTLRTAIADVQPDVVVNAAAYTAVDKAESEEALAHKVNASGAGDLAAACARAGASLIHISTDYVFDGAKGAPEWPSGPVQCDCRPTGRKAREVLREAGAIVGRVDVGRTARPDARRLYSARRDSSSGSPRPGRCAKRLRCRTSGCRGKKYRRFGARSPLSNVRHR